jgi:hypothetical protein
MSWQRGRDSDRRRRVGDDHVHPDLWSERDHERFEERLGQELHGIRQELKLLGRIAGGLSLAATIGPILVVIFLRFILPPGP